MDQSKLLLEAQETLTHFWKGNLRKTLSIPGIVVCGEQSSGKSSVLELISTLRYPTGDTMCTRFATRVETKYSKNTQIRATIEPSDDKSMEERKDLLAWGQDKVKTDLSCFGDLITAAGKKMGTTSRVGFMRDTLLLRVRGPSLPCFSFVDLPGMIRSTRDQQDDSDIEHIEKLNDSYMKDTHNLVLIVVSAANDIENQGVLRRALTHDPTGERTIGVITKPDLCRERPAVEAQYISLLKANIQSKYLWKHGWYVVKCRNALQQVMTTKEREEMETNFLSLAPWDGVPEHRKGGAQLCRKLQEILLRSFLASLPRLKDEINGQILAWQTQVKTIVGLRAANAGNPTEHLRTCVEEVQTRMARGFRSMFDSFPRELDALTVSFLQTLVDHGHCYEFDQPTVVSQSRKFGKQRPVSDSGEWELLPLCPVDDLYQHAIEIVEQAKSDAGQVTESMYGQVYRYQICRWPFLLQQFLAKAVKLFTALLQDACRRCFDPQILKQVQDLVVAPHIARLVEVLELKNLHVMRSPTPSSTCVRAEAMNAAWDAQMHRSVAQRIQEVYRLEGKSSTSKDVHKKDCAQMLEGMANAKFDAKELTARQAVSVAQLMYIESLDTLHGEYSSMSVMDDMQQALRQSTEQVLSSITATLATEIYNGGAANRAKVKAMKDDIAEYQSCLMRIQHLEQMALDEA